MQIIYLFTVIMRDIAQEILTHAKNVTIMYVILETYKKQSTAYDVDNVVRKLNLESTGSNIKESLGLLKAIKIVKDGVNNEA